MSVYNYSLFDVSQRVDKRVCLDLAFFLAEFLDKT